MGIELKLVNIVEPQPIKAGDPIVFEQRGKPALFEKGQKGFFVRDEGLDGLRVIDTDGNQYLVPRAWVKRDVAALRDAIDRAVREASLQEACREMSEAGVALLDENAKLKASKECLSKLVYNGEAVPLESCTFEPATEGAPEQLWFSPWTRMGTAKETEGAVQYVREDVHKQSVDKALKAASERMCAHVTTYCDMRGDWFPAIMGFCGPRVMTKLAAEEHQATKRRVIRKIIEGNSYTEI